MDSETKEKHWLKYKDSTTKKKKKKKKNKKKNKKNTMKTRHAI